MLNDTKTYPKALAVVLQEASGILSMDIAELCNADADSKGLEDVNIAQLVVKSCISRDYSTT